MKENSRPRRLITLAFAAAGAAVLVAASTTAAASADPSPTPTSAASAAAADGSAYSGKAKPVHIEVFSPEKHNNAGIQGKGWFVDMELDFPGGPDGLHKSGFTDLQLTGPGVHNNVAPAPGTFSTGHDDRNPGVVVLTSTTVSTLPGFTGPGTNLANLFNITGVTNRTAQETELWDTWLVGAPIAGQDIDTVLTVAEVADLNHNGIYDDAPDVVNDLNHDGKIDAKDLWMLGVASNVVTVPFHITGAAA
jgi:hypothetical protein